MNEILDLLMWAMEIEHELNEAGKTEVRELVCSCVERVCSSSGEVVASNEISKN